YSSTPYTNSLILNDKVLVPIFGSDLDDEALQTYADAMPGYEILGFTGSWVSDDAIHCRAKGIADQYMLRLVHVPLQDRENNGQPYEVEADIHSYSNLPMVPGTPELMWRLEGQTTWNTVAMGDQGDDIYVGYIPEQANFSTIEYYVHAEDESGRREDHPYIGAPDPHSFHIGPDVIAPEIVHQPLGNLSTYEWPATITCIATDNGAISSVTVEWFLNSAQQTDVTLTNVGGDIYSGQLTGTVSIGDNYEYRIVAVDNSSAANTTYDPASGYHGGDIVTGYLADMEDGAPGWSHSNVLPSFGDQWHLSTQQNHTQGGVQSWKCGDTGLGDYGNLLDAGLVTTEYTIETGSRLSFWQRMAAETSSSYPGYAYDGGLVEISVAGGAWEQISPVGGYPYLVRVGSTPGPFAAETPFFSGFTNGWESVDFDLSGYTGNVQFRFRFGSDGSAGEEGWFIDDVLVVSGGAAPPNMTIDLTYLSGSPVPAGGGNVYFDVFAENAGSVPLDYDAWLETAYEGGVPTTVVMRTFSNYQPGWTINRPNMFFPVPGTYAAGNYTFAGKVGVNPNVWWDESSFPFVKEGTVGIANFQPFVPDGVPDPFDRIDVPDGVQQMPDEFALHGAYPNPFNPTTAISYQLSAFSHVNLSVYDVSGRKVTTLVDGYRDAGLHEVTFDASGLASGVYLYRLEVSGSGTIPSTAMGKMVLMK
ncbi:T9SS type A sorting domain-containing protein, partial [bacterium]|nr:T9SS type A sorting domain-containing protein [bacterium]